MTMRTGLLVAILLGTPLALLAGVPRPQALPRMTADQWRADIDFFARELPKRHLNAFHATPREEFDRSVDHLNIHLNVDLLFCRPS
jgi:hypothetical protein